MDRQVFHKVEEFFSQYPQRTYPKNQIIIFGGESPEKVFYLTSGKVTQYDISYRGDEIVINIYKAPSFFPMSWAINKTANQYFFKAEEESLVHIAPPEAVVLFLKENPEVTYDLLSRLYIGVEAVLERTVHLMAGSARSRLLHELVIECRRFGKPVTNNSYLLNIHESDLAARSGLARETVSREIKHLKDKNLIELSYGSVLIKDFKRIEILLGQTV